MSSNIFLKEITLTKLLKHTPYTYYVEDVASNYKIALINASGQFSTSDGSHNIPLYIVFCPNDQSCDSFDNVIDGTSLYDVDTNPNELIAHLNFVTYPVNTPELLSTKEIIQVCTDCTESHRLITDSEIEKFGPNTNKFDIVLTAESLRKDTTYAYKVNPISANWPVFIDSLSGIINTSDYAAGGYKERHAVINLTAHFAPSSGTGHGNMPYSMPEGIDNDVLKSTFSVSLYPIDSPENKAVSKNITMSCDDCLYRPLFDISSSTIANTNDTEFNVDVNINQLLPNTSYTYTYELLDSNWPIIITNQSGTFSTEHANHYSLNSKIVFCTEDSCPSGTNNIVSPITTDTDTENKYVKLSVRLDTPESCYGLHNSNFYTVNTVIPEPPPPVFPTMSIQITSEDRCNI